ncbi:hypothetical protein PRNP1_004437 [Phytophthora ramorum]
MDRVSSIFARVELGRATHALTSDVIGHVLPRATVGGGGMFIKALPPIPPTRAAAFNTPKATSLAQQTPLDYLTEASLARWTTKDSYGTYETLPRTQHETAKPPVIPFASSTPTQPLPQPVATSRTVPSVKTIRSAGSNAAKPKRKRIRIKTPRRREQCRTNQARYRKKQSEQAKEAETSVEQLQREIPILEMQHSRLISNAKSSAWYVVVEYFHLFRNGTRLSRQVSPGPEAWLQKSEAQQQLVFLQTSVASDVVLGERRGIDALVEQWERCTSYFDDLQFQLEHMTRISNDFTTATGSLNVTISGSTMQNVFPHLMGGDGGQYNTSQEDKTALLRSKLLGQRLCLPCRLSFEWDEASKRVVRLETTVDFLPSLLHLLGPIDDAAFVLEHALIAQDGAIGEI